jgi:GT2 family glycosyltransferase
MLKGPQICMPGVTVVIPNWNRRDLIVSLLDRLRAQTCPIEEIIVVDNGSHDGSVEAARSKGARVIPLGANFGFSHAVNRGIAESRTEWIAILNNDVDPAPEWLARLMTAADRPRVWFATGKLLDRSKPESIDGTYDVLCRGACAWRAGHGRRDGPLWDQPARIRFAPFTAALFRAELFQKVGGLDQRFESYLEDVDFCLRCAMEGYTGMYVPGAVAHHSGSATLGAWHKDTIRRISRNQVLLVAKHYPSRYFVRYGWSIFVAQMLWGLVAVRHLRALSFVRGKIEGLWMFAGVRRESRRNGGLRRGLSRILEQGDSEIFRLQRSSGFDSYWRIYFSLTGGM